MPRLSNYSRDAALIAARHFAEGGSLRGACRLLPNDHSRLCRWRDRHPEFRALIEVAGILLTLNESIALDPPAATETERDFAKWLSEHLYAPPGEVQAGLWRYIEKAGRAGGPLIADELLEQLWQSEAETEMEDPT